MKALSIKQPWVHAIFRLGKNIENRNWGTNFRGVVAVHASKSTPKIEYLYAVEDVHEIAPIPTQSIKDSFVEFPPVFGAIIGTVEIVGCVEFSTGQWFQGDFGFVLENPRLLKTPIPCKGALGFWEVPQNILEQFIFV